MNWCKGHQYGSTYMVVRLSNLRSKTGKKCLFCLFCPFWTLCRTAWQPYRSSHIDALRISLSHWLKDQKYWELAVLKNSFFLCRPLWIFFLLHPHENQLKFLDLGRNGSKFWWLLWFPAQNNTCVNIGNTVQCIPYRSSWMWRVLTSKVC
jgi:hypothetical protein